MRILVVEDEPTIAIGLQDDLEMEGYQVVKLQKFGSVVEDITREMPDAILMDVHLNDLDGLTFLRQIRETEAIKELVVIMSSGMDKQYESDQAGANAFLLKPYMPDELISKISNLLV